MVLTTVIAAGVGYVAGAFTPAIGRKIKAFFVKETTALKADVKADEAAVAKKV
jgi:hypothetical protein